MFLPKPTARSGLDRDSRSEKPDLVVLDIMLPGLDGSKYLPNCSQ